MYFPKIFRVCLGYFNDVEKAKDVTQDTFVTVFGHLKSLKNTDNISGWIYRIASNKCLKQLQNDKKNSGFTGYEAFYLFGYSWKTINRQKKEYLLNSRDFIRSLSEREKSDIRTPVFKGCLCVSLLMIALFFYFLDDLLLFPKGLLVSGVVLAAGLVLLWGIVKPVYGKRINETFVHRINIILKQVNVS